MSKKFTNCAIPFDPTQDGFGRPSDYSFKNISPHMFLWSRLLQRVISQAGTFMLTGKFHEQECGIYKCEGGCRIEGIGDLVLTKRGCYFDYSRSDGDKEHLKKMADLISHIVLHWDPENPIDSMIEAACEQSGASKKQLKKAIDSSSCGGVFGSDALNDLFDHNPFGKFPHDRSYREFCLIYFHGKTKAEVRQIFVDEDRGEAYMKTMNDLRRAASCDRYYSPFMCCSPSRKDKHIQFWINDGRDHFGWYTPFQLDQLITAMKTGDKHALGLESKRG